MTDATPPSQSSRARLAVWCWRALLSVAIIIPLEFTGESIYPAGLDTHNVRLALALLMGPEESRFSEMPDQVDLTLDGARAIFHKGESAYARLADLLQNGRTPEMLRSREASLTAFRSPAGDLVIRSYGIASHFKIARSGSIYWIYIPSLKSVSTAIIVFTVGPKVAELVKSQAAK